VSDLNDLTELPVPLSVPLPFHGEALLTFLGRHAVAGVEAWSDETDEGGRSICYRRTLRLPYASAVLRLRWSDGALTAGLDLGDQRDLAAGQSRIAHLCDLSVDPVEVAAHLSRDEQLRPLVAAAAGLRVPGVVDLHEHLFRTMLGQQISLAGAANLAAKLVRRFGEALPASLAGGPATAPLTHLFPTAAALAAADPVTLPMPRARGRALVLTAEALASGTLVLESGSDAAETRARLLSCPGIGPWTADYVLMRGLHQPDILLASDLVIKRELLARGLSSTGHWAPWRSYATMHLWRAYTG
jgi:AraC family transcriptional regulator of adaptative response / DNA-3-methyladenine glycosylase II